MENNILELCNIRGICGHEKKVSNYIESKVGQKYETKRDDFGNLLCFKENIKNGPMIVFVANMDEAGFIVSGIDSKGFVKYSPLGNLKSDDISSKRVKFQNNVYGVVLADKNHGDEGIDIAATSFEEASEILNIGDIACLSSNAEVFGDKVIARNCSSRIGCAILLNAMESIECSKYNLCFAFAAQGMLGNRGISVLSNYLKGDCFISLDHFEVKEFSENPLIALKDNTMFYNSEIVNGIEEDYLKNNQSYIKKIISGKQGLLSPFKKNSSHAKMVSLLYQLKYIGTGNEMASISNAKNIKTIIDIIVNSDIITVERTSRR